MIDENVTGRPELLEVGGFNAEYQQLPLVAMDLVKYNVEALKKEGAMELAALAQKARKYLNLLLDKAILYCEEDES